MFAPVASSQASRAASRGSSDGCSRIGIASSAPDLRARWKIIRLQRWWRRLRGVRLFTRVGGGEDVVPQLLADRHAEVRAAAATWASDHPSPALIEFLRPVRERYAELADDPGETAAVLKRGAEKAQQVAGATLARAKEAIGLLPRA